MISKAPTVVPVFPAFCFLGANLPLLWFETIEGVPLYGPRRMAKAIRKDGPMNAGHRTKLLEHLARRQPRCRMTSTTGQSARQIQLAGNGKRRST